MLKGRWEIDKKEMLDLILEAKRKDPETGSFSVWLPEYLVAHISTIIRPNEPLTLEQLREMDGEPVWFDTIKRWGIVKVCQDGTFLLTKSGEFEVGYITRRKYYRRPPERQEDT